MISVLYETNDSDRCVPKIFIHQERALARARSKEWHTRVTVAAKKIADAEARGLRPPMSDLHRRSAERLRDLCSVNGGVYVREHKRVSFPVVHLDEPAGIASIDVEQVSPPLHPDRHWTAWLLLYLVVVAAVATFVAVVEERRKQEPVRWRFAQGCYNQPLTRVFVRCWWRYC